MKNKRLLYLLGAGTLTGLAGTAGGAAASQHHLHDGGPAAGRRAGLCRGRVGRDAQPRPVRAPVARFHQRRVGQPGQRRLPGQPDNGQIHLVDGHGDQRAEPQSQSPDAGPRAHRCRLPDRLCRQGPLERRPPPAPTNGGPSAWASTAIGRLIRSTTSTTMRSTIRTVPTANPCTSASRGSTARRSSRDLPSTTSASMPATGSPLR